MAIKLYSLQRAEPEEGEQLRRQLDEAGIDYYETHSGHWGNLSSRHLATR